jgi:serine/threonine protein kinase
VTLTGGMGEVYKARDTKLSREIAVRVLPEAFTENQERLARFEREARLLAKRPKKSSVVEEIGSQHFG